MKATSILATIHLPLDVPPSGFAPQERAAWQQLVHAGLPAGIAVMHANPVAQAGQLVTRFGKVLEFAGPAQPASRRFHPGSNSGRGDPCRRTDAETTAKHLHHMRKKSTQTPVGGEDVFG